MTLTKMDCIVVLVLLIIISNQINVSVSSEHRKPKFGFELFEIIRKEFCNDICDIPITNNRTSKTMILCLLKCGTLDEISSKPTSSVSLSSTVISSSATPPTTASVLLTSSLNSTSNTQSTVSSSNSTSNTQSTVSSSNSTSNKQSTVSTSIANMTTIDHFAVIPISQWAIPNIIYNQNY